MIVQINQSDKKIYFFDISFFFYFKPQSQTEINANRTSLTVNKDSNSHSTGGIVIYELWFIHINKEHLALKE